MTTEAASAPFGGKPQGVADLLRDAIEAGDAPAMVVVTVPAPLAPLETLLDRAGEEDAIVWAPPEGPSFAAVGAAAVLVGKGADRMGEVRRAAEALFPRVVQSAGADPITAPRCFGGFAFRPGAASAEPWTDFGDARFVFPRFTYTREADRAFFTFAASGDELADESRRRALVATAEQLQGALRAAASKGDAGEPPKDRVVVARSEASEAEWRDLVLSVRDLIRRGDLEKVVVARRTALTFDSAVRASEVLAELARAAEFCTRFAFRRGPATFLGATPERLVRRQGLDVETEALAGSSRPGDAARAAELLGSSKERAEHAPVVREILRILAPLCVSLEHPDRPEVKALRHLIHLRTPVRGRLARPVHVLELVERLHPTPAVGGVPRAEAVELIVQKEPSERGWYASPVGWFDGNGDGEFVVGLRSGVVLGDRAYLYAGGGIVKDSDPEAEYAETRMKLATLCAALRVEQ